MSVGFALSVCFLTFYLQIKLFCMHPVKMMMESKLEVHKDKTLREATEMAYKVCCVCSLSDSPTAKQQQLNCLYMHQKESRQTCCIFIQTELVATFLVVSVFSSSADGARGSGLPGLLPFGKVR